jgi:F-type H+-transporting ATPase subunit gamma
VASGKEIRTQIASIKNTGKITSAMEMVAASKMKKAQDRMSASRPYAQKIADIISRLAYAHSEYQHSYMQTREEVKTVGFIIVSSDRGLCGGLNNNLFRKLLKDFKAIQDSGKKIELCTIGKKASSFFKSVGMNIVAQTTDLGDTPHYNDLLGAIKIMLDKFDNSEIDEVNLAFNTFENTMTQAPTVRTIVPMQVAKVEGFDHHWDYIYEPEAEEVLSALITRYIESSVYQSVVENIACEQSARMIAMKSATDNAADMVDELSLVYNKARQAAITQEISEIVGGAAAV